MSVEVVLVLLVVVYSMLLVLPLGANYLLANYYPRAYNEYLNDLLPGISAGLIVLFGGEYADKIGLSPRGIFASIALLGLVFITSAMAFVARIILRRLGSPGQKGKPRPN